MVGEYAEAAGERGHVDLPHVGVRVVHRVRRREGERHLGHAALLQHGTVCVKKATLKVPDRVMIHKEEIRDKTGQFPQNLRVNVTMSLSS